MILERCKYTRKCDLEQYNNNSFESCFIELQTAKTSLIIGSVYRPPNTSVEEFLKTFQLVTEVARKQRPTKNLIIGLDHNLDLLKSSSHNPTQQFLEMLYELRMLPTITKPTRITMSSATLIDNVLVNMELASSVTSGIIEDHISDHLPCYNIIRDINTTKRPALVVTSRDTRAKNLTAIKRRLENNPNLLLPQHVDCVDEQFDEFHRKLLAEIDHFLPMRTRKINDKAVRREVWVSSGLLISINKCKKLYRKHLKDRSNRDVYDKYHQYNTQLKRTKRAARVLHYSMKCTEHRNNTSKLWRTINEVIKKTNNKTEVIDALRINNLEEKHGRKIVNELARYFLNVGKNLAENMPLSKRSINSYLKDVQSNSKSIFLSPVTPSEVMKIINKLMPKNSSGIDNINNKIIKELGPQICEPLCTIFNTSLLTGKFPAAMKKAKVVPLYKSKDRMLSTNYRPISLLLTISKVLEKLMYKRVYSFLCTTNQLYVSQYGFRKQHSCEQAIGELVVNITKGFEYGKFSAGIFLDLSKAFDSLEHNVVYLKLEKYGLRGTCLNWFKSYLSDRSLLVSCKSGDAGTVNTSDTYDVKYGTPQGSCLGPLIFLIFCNDLQRHLVFLSCIQFADDTTLYITHKNLNYIRFCIETDLEILKDWFIANKLTLNVGKSVCILFSRCRMDYHLNIRIGDEIIPQAKSTKFLGMWIDQSLSWSDHIAKTMLKLKSRMNLLHHGEKVPHTTCSMGALLCPTP